MNPNRLPHRITSYNVCYTKLLRVGRRYAYRRIADCHIVIIQSRYFVSEYNRNITRICAPAAASFQDHFGLVSKLVTDSTNIYFSRPDKELVESWEGFGDMVDYAARNGFPEDELKARNNFV